MTRRNDFPDELQVYGIYLQMFARIPLLILLMMIVSGAGSLLLERFDDSILLSENPLHIAMQLVNEERMEQVLYLVKFSHQYLPVDTEYSYTDLEHQAKEALESPWYVMEHFATGALTGEASDTAGLVGALTLDLLLIGDIRDLIVQGYKELDSGQGDEIILGLSAAGLLLALVPELSLAPSLFKTFWRGNRFSSLFQKQVLDAAREARRSGNTKVLRRMMGNFSDVVEALGAGPAMTVMKRVDTIDDLALLARKAKIAPIETYSLSSINGIKALEDISTTSTKQGKLLKRVKLATHQQKVFAKALRLISVIWIIIIFWISLLLFYFIIKGGRKTV